MPHASRRKLPWWIPLVAVVVGAVWWFAPATESVVAPPAQGKPMESLPVEIPPAPPRVEQVPEIQAPTVAPTPTTQVAAMAAPVAGLVDPGAGGGAGNAPGLDLGLEGGPDGMAVAAGGGGKGNGIGTGTGDGVGTQRMIYQLGQVDQDAGVDRLVDPPYPRRAKEDGVQATLELRILVDERGRVEKLEVQGAPPGYGFETAIQSASRDWRFKPAQLGGVPVPQWVRIPYTFHLE
ncbi:MAG: energy transducer TonB [Fibrobacteres bacterium]|nr:energy transducer TonB [Fibrobacterota bacterium]